LSRLQCHRIPCPLDQHTLHLHSYSYSAIFVYITTNMYLRCSFTFRTFFTINHLS
jgi:hypothetical protein